MSEVPAEAAAAACRRDLSACVCCGTLVAQRTHSARRRNPDAGDSLTNLLTFLGDGTRPWDAADHRARVDSALDPTYEARGFTVPWGQDPALVPVMISSSPLGGSTVWLNETETYSTVSPAEAAA